MSGAPVEMGTAVISAREGSAHFVLALRSPLGWAGFAGALLVVTVVLGSLTVRQTLAERSAAGSRAEDFRRAIALEPDRAEYHNLLGEQYLNSVASYDPAMAVTAFRRAVELNPYNAVYWLNLARAYEGQGRSREALRAALTARRNDPSDPALAWAVGNFYANSGAVRPALQAWKQAIVGNATYAPLAFELGWKLAPDSSVLLENLIPDRTQLDFWFLDFLLRKRVGDPAPVWNRIVRRGTPFPPAWAKNYLDLFISRNDSVTARKLWEEFLRVAVPNRTIDPANLVYNGGFEEELLGVGFGWRWMDTDCASLVLDNSLAYEGRRSARIDFDGTKNLHFAHFYQIIPVEPGRRYKVTTFLRAQEITSSSGPRLRVTDFQNMGFLNISGTPVFNTGRWVEERLEFVAPPPTRLVAVGIWRPSSTRFSPQIRGSVWLDNVRMEEVGGGERP